MESIVGINFEKSISDKDIAMKNGVELLKNLLRNPKLTHSRRKQIVNETVIKMHEQTGTPLVLAAFNGFTEVVEMLLGNDLVDVEQTCNLFLEGKKEAKGVTALWAATYAGHLDVVNLLVLAESDVNHATKTKSSPLRTACFRGRLEIVQVLVKAGADVNAANLEGNSCLMAAAYGGHLEVVNFLLKSAADVDQKDFYGNTALHFAADRGHLEVMKQLSNTSPLTHNHEGMTPLKLACSNCHEEVVKFFIRRKKCTRVEVIQSLELLGASFANHPEHHNVLKAYWYMWAAMKERFSDPNGIVHKLSRPPLRAYGYRIECENPNELRNIKNDKYYIQIEGLIMRERILRLNGRSLAAHVRFRAACLAQQQNYRESQELWKHALDLEEKHSPIISEDLFRIAQLLINMLHVRLNPVFSHVKELFSLCLSEESDYMQEESETEDDQEKGRVSYLLDKDLHTSLYLLFVLMQMDLTLEEEEECQKLVKKFANLDLRTSQGSTPLHIAASDKSTAEDSVVKETCRFPCIEIIRLLVESGASVNAQDKAGNTPLHIVLQLPENRPEIRSVQFDIVGELVEAGTDLNIINNDNYKPCDLVRGEELKRLVSSLTDDIEM